MVRHIPKLLNSVSQAFIFPEISNVFLRYLKFANHHVGASNGNFVIASFITPINHMFLLFVVSVRLRTNWINIYYH